MILPVKCYVSDLLTIDGYSEMVMAFRLGVSLDKIRHMVKAQLNELTLREALSLVRFYLGAFGRDDL